MIERTPLGRIGFGSSDSGLGRFAQPVVVVESGGKYELGNRLAAGATNRLRRTVDVDFVIAIGGNRQRAVEAGNSGAAIVGSAGWQQAQ